MKNSDYVYRTGNQVPVYAADDYRSPEGFSRYAHKELGCDIPVGQTRTAWYHRLKSEMKAHGWTWEDMAKTVRFLKAHNRQAYMKSIYSILYEVYDAKRWVEHVDDWEFHGKVADALKTEEDETWRRKLSLAKGKALEQVYEQWLKERSDEV